MSVRVGEKKKPILKYGLTYLKIKILTVKLKKLFEFILKKTIKYINEQFMIV